MHDPVDTTELMSNTNNSNAKTLEAAQRHMQIVKLFQNTLDPTPTEDQITLGIKLDN